MRKSRETYYGDRETHECKFSRKRGFLPCKLNYRVTIDNVSEKVRVERCGQWHSHEKDPNCQDVERLELARRQSAFSPQSGSKKWTVISSVTAPWDSRAIFVTTPWAVGMHFREVTGRMEASEEVGVFIIPTK